MSAVQESTNPIFSRKQPKVWTADEFGGLHMLSRQKQSRSRILMEEINPGIKGCVDLEVLLMNSEPGISSAALSFRFDTWEDRYQFSSLNSWMKWWPPRTLPGCKAWFTCAALLSQLSLQTQGLHAGDCHLTQTVLPCRSLSLWLNTDESLYYVWTCVSLLTNHENSQ